MATKACNFLPYLGNNRIHTIKIRLDTLHEAGFNFDTMGENQSVVSNNVITDSCTNKRSKPEMASESQLGLRSHQFQAFLPPF